jgi:hypothetical protein
MSLIAKKAKTLISYLKNDHAFLFLIYLTYICILRFKFESHHCKQNKILEDIITHLSYTIILYLALACMQNYDISGHFCF